MKYLDWKNKGLTEGYIISTEDYVWAYPKYNPMPCWMFSPGLENCFIFKNIDEIINYFLIKDEDEDEDFSRYKIHRLDTKYEGQTNLMDFNIPNLILKRKLKML